MEAPVICRLSRQMLYTAVVFGFLTLAISYVGLSDPQTTPLETLAGASLFGVPTFFIIVAYFRCRIIASENGLEIRNTFRTEFIEWHQVNDFYYKLSSSSKQSREPYVFIEYGARRRQISRDFDNILTLLKVVELKACNAKVKIFDFKATRDLLDTPQVFEYGNPSIWLPILLALVSWLTSIGILIFPAIAKQGWGHFYDSTFGILPPPMNWLLGITLLIFTGIIPAMCLTGIPIIKTIRKFQSQQITASKSGIEWQKGADKIEIPWSEVKRYHLEKMEGHFQRQLFVVESGDKRICFIKSISRFSVLRQLIRQNSKYAETMQWDFAAGQHEETLGRSSVIGEDGKQVFHYRTRTNRLFLWGGIALFLCMLLTARLGENDSSTNPVFIAIALISGAIAVYSGLAYYGSRVEITAKGVRHITLLQKTFIGWSEIQTLKAKNSYLIIGAHKTIRLGYFLSEGTHFMETVTQHSGKQWEKPQEQAGIITDH